MKSAVIDWRPCYSVLCHSATNEMFRGEGDIDEPFPHCLLLIGKEKNTARTFNVLIYCIYSCAWLAAGMGWLLKKYLERIEKKRRGRKK